MMMEEKLGERNLPRFFFHFSFSHSVEKEKLIVSRSHHQHNFIWNSNGSLVDEGRKAGDFVGNLHMKNASLFARCYSRKP